MYKLKYYFYFFLALVLTSVPTKTYSENHNLNEVIELIQKDLKTLERAVYSENFSSDQESGQNINNMDQNSEEVLTRHLLKLSEIEKQFQDLTNRFEEINFKLDKLSSRLSKIQADNQLRFQQLEEGTIINNTGDDQQLSSASDQKIKLIGTKGRFESDQKNRGLFLNVDDKSPKSLNPYFCSSFKNPENKLEWSGYGIDSIVDFLYSVSSLISGKIMLRDMPRSKPSFNESIYSTSVLQAAQKSLDSNSDWIELKEIND